jgi:hypothetical protein
MLVNDNPVKGGEMCNLPYRNFLVTLASRDDGAQCQIKLSSPCVCDLDEFVASIADTLPITNPRVVDIDDKALAHLPTVDLLGPMSTAS